MSWIVALIFLGVLILVHEAGHLVMGILTGVTVETFSLGYGSALVSKKIKGIKFQIGIFPFGGFCKFKGEDPSTPSLSKDAFYNVHPLKRMLIAVGGPLFNFIFAFLLLSFLATRAQTEVIFPPVIEVFPSYKYMKGEDKETLAYKAGLRNGDRILYMDETKIENDRDILSFLSNPDNLEKDKIIKITVLRNNKQYTFRIAADDIREAEGNIGWLWGGSLIIDNVMKGYPADAVDLRKGDKITGVDGVEVNYMSEARISIWENPGTKITLSIIRDGVSTNIEIVPLREKIKESDYGLAGFGFKPAEHETIKHEALGIFPALASGFNESVSYVSLILRGLGKLVHGKMPVRESLGGPVRIMQMTSEVAKSSNPIISLMDFGAVISLILFVMNLLPIPMVDGSMVLYSLWEMITRKPIKREVLMRIQSVGVVLLISLGIYVMFNDILRLLG